MRRLYLIFVFLIITAPIFGQNDHDSICPNGDYKKDWTTVISKDGLIGFINSEGEEVVEPAYTSVGEFGEYKEDWAMVTEEGFMGFINSQGEEVVEPAYTYVGEFGEYKEDWAAVTKEGVMGFIDSEGDEVIKPKYSDISIQDGNLKGATPVSKEIIQK